MTYQCCHLMRVLPGTLSTASQPHRGLPWLGFGTENVWRVPWTACSWVHFPAAEDLLIAPPPQDICGRERARAPPPSPGLSPAVPDLPRRGCLPPFLPPQELMEALGFLCKNRLCQGGDAGSLLGASATVPELVAGLSSLIHSHLQCLENSEAPPQGESNMRLAPADSRAPHSACRTSRRPRLPSQGLVSADSPPLPPFQRGPAASTVT